MTSRNEAGSSMRRRKRRAELPARSVRVFFTVAWCSFLARAVATVLFFAFVDPAPFAAPDG
jgi:hypothetical protein